MTTTSTINQQVIADQLDLSTATVSKALSNASGVNPDTRARVLQVAEESGYLAAREQRLERRARTRQSTHHFIGVLARSSYQPGVFAAPRSFFTGVSELASTLNVTLVPQEVLHSVDDHAILDPKFQTPALRNNSLSGILVIGQWSPDVIQRLHRIAPCVALPFTIPGADVDQIGLDHSGAVSGLVQHLFDLGHRRIGFFGRCHALSWSTERFAGFINGITRWQLDYRPEDVVDMAEPPLMEEGHDDAWAEYARRGVEATKAGVTAWVCSSDWPGNHLHRALVASGRRVPDDVSVVGFDDTEPVTLGMPPLTSTHLPRSEIGMAAVNRLVERIDSSDRSTYRVQFSCPFVDHGTTAPCPEVAR